MEIRIYRFEDKTLDLRKSILGIGSQACRWSIDREYQEHSYDEANLIITLEAPHDNYHRELLGYTKYIPAFIEIVISDHIATILLLCAAEFETVRLGAYILCIAIKYLEDLGIDDIYLEASTERNMNYYESIGFEYLNITEKGTYQMKKGKYTLCDKIIARTELALRTTTENLYVVL